MSSTLATPKVREKKCTKKKPKLEKLCAEREANPKIAELIDVDGFVREGFDVVIREPCQIHYLNYSLLPPSVRRPTLFRLGCLRYRV